MGYVIAAILVVLIVGAGIAFFVRAATTRKGQATIAAPDEGTPLGDTEQHSSEIESEGAERGGTPPSSPGVGGPGEGGAGGEGEGSRPVTEHVSDPPR
jgi:hypothetical protein